jgi:hypothetical protein
MALWVGTSLISRLPHRRFVDQSPLGRLTAALGAGIGQAVQSRNSIDGVLDTVAERPAPARRAAGVVGEGWERYRHRSHARRRAVVPTTDLRFVVHVGELTGGRRLLSDDLAWLTPWWTRRRGARSDPALHERYEVSCAKKKCRSSRPRPTGSAARADQPAFLFNALTTTGYLIESAPPPHEP